MFNNEIVQACLLPIVTLEGNISKHAPTYLNEDILTKAIPVAADFDAYIEKIISGSIDKMLYSVINSKKINTFVRSVIADFKLFDGRADYDNKNANTGRFCFLEIKAKNNEDLVMILKRVSFQIDTACPDLKLYLYSDNQPSQALKVIPLDYAAGLSVQWFNTLTNADAALNLPSLSDDDTTYYLGYYETDLAPGAQSIKKVTDYTTGPCMTGCPGQERNAAYFKTRVQYINMKIGYVDAQNLNGVALPDMQNAVWVDRNNFGMNIDANIICDISEFICSNKQIFIEPLALQAAIDLLNVIIHSERDNIDLQKAQQGCLFALSGNADNFGMGLYKVYAKMIDALDVDLGGFNKACLACSKKPGIIQRYV